MGPEGSQTYGGLQEEERGAYAEESGFEGVVGGEEEERLAGHSV